MFTNGFAGVNGGDMKNIEQHAAIIAELGGSKSLSEELGQSRQNINNWKKRGIPWRWRPRIADLAVAAGKQSSLPDNFFKSE